MSEFHRGRATVLQRDLDEREESAFRQLLDLLGIDPAEASEVSITADWESAHGLRLSVSMRPTALIAFGQK